MAEDIVRVLRILEYVGPRSWVETTLDNCAVKGTKTFAQRNGTCSIRSAIVGDYPEILNFLNKGD